MGGTPTVANTTLIQAFGQDGNDDISLNESFGLLPGANLFGGNGNDLLTGGSGADQLFGGADDDILFGRDGADHLFGGDGNDTLSGGAGDDQVSGEAGDDLMIWNRGDGTDLFEGGDGVDTAEVNTGNGSEIFTIVANGTRVRLDRISPAPFSLDIGTTENLVVHANGGDDTITAGNGLAALIALTLDGGDGNDTITGGDGADLILGGAGNDIVTGGRGNDTALLGDDDDTFIWNPGDGSDTVEGQGGTDTLQFNGANIAENIDISANGSRVRFTRDVANIVMDLNSVEKINFQALGGADHVTVNDLAGTGVQRVAIDLQASGGGSDGAADNVTVNAAGSSDNIAVTLAGAEILVNGLAAQTSIVGQEAANDALVINGLDGADVIDASALAAGQIKLTIDGGDGDDVITGSAGADVLIGGNNNDTVIGGRGDDVALLGADDDTFIWNPGDGSDVVEGEGGFDTLQFNGANVAENIDISANGGRVRLTRDVANIVMDLNGVEKISFKALGGADTITVNDLSSTGVTQVAVDLSASGGGGDGAADKVIVNSTAGDDQITITQSGQTVMVNGLPAQVAINGKEAGDTLVINGLAGADVIDASGLAAGVMALTINGGDDADRIIGSAGNDTVNGGRGNDVALLGGGDDTFVWNPGDGSDTVEGQGGTDTLDFNGANIAEHIDISANGSRVLFTRDVANIVMDLDGTEKIAFHALGGADTITVNDLTGTAAKQVAIDLSASGGGSDGAADTVVVNGSGSADAVTVTQSGQGILINGLPARVSISGQEAANDTLRINGMDGADVIDASALNAGQIHLVIDGGAGNDVITGSHGNDLLSGGADDDRFIWKVGSAADIITDFAAGNGTPDKIDVRAFAGAGIHDFNGVLAHAAQIGADTVIDFGGGDTMTLLNVAKTNLSTDDFIFGEAKPHLTSITASPATGAELPGATIHFTLGFDEAIHVSGGTPALTLNNGQSAIYNAAATALLGDPSKLVFDYAIYDSAQPTPTLAITGFNANGASVDDFAGNHADLANVTATFNGLSVQAQGIPASFYFAPSPPLPFPAFGDELRHSDSIAAPWGFGLQAFAEAYESSGHFPIADHHAISDFHLA
ncbi:beta strand repeat-containing protein [Bradyrhizobium sp.]|uniref:beta strand repeat-containing protein n=1 Tax=Bradyrhizobium sp. TaxID=376 RepID=UPI002CDF2A7B|nr:calcium-binding protein [Bradyrhizobium sp.]HMM87689.1 calcium-binding protein [Bradyrhizobium sp.]